ncbi:hypothetical protein SDC9_86109 [bioreactor metagenome]|uniref:Uncharacterized protein n=1 Tax=bioreactor metagenome TaxID=1076179 RepID=A0A644ZF50_9ZZZZ
MKTRTQMTLNPKFLSQIDEFLGISGLTRSSYVENCMIRDVSTIRKLLNEPKILEEFGNDQNTIISNYFRGRIEKGVING